MIVFVGRQNSGKSTLFNRLLGSKKAVVSEIPGTTIDRKKATFNWQGNDIPICDIAGLPIDKNNPLFDEMNKQALTAISEAHEIVLVIDGRTGINQDDLKLADWLRKQNKNYTLVVNKIDEVKQLSISIENDISKYFFDAQKIFYLSALHGKNINELLDYLTKFAKPNISPKIPQVVIVGRQNTGKSTLFNQILQQDRSIISSSAGTTRDSIEEPYKKNGMNIKIIDTAGMRKKSKISEAIETQSIDETLKNIASADEVVCLIDANEGPTQQDVKIIDYAQKIKKRLIIAVNKWDLTGLDKDEAKKMIISRFSFLKLIPIVPISAKTGWNVKSLIILMQQLLNKRGV